MIKSYREITGRYLRINKKRTVLTIIGIILSVALISAIGFFLKSMQAAQIEDIKNTYGSMHLIYKKVEDDLVTKINTNPNVEKSGIYGVGQERAINDKLMIREIFGTDEALKLMPYSLKEGRFPEKNREVAMEGWFISKIQNGAKIGDTIKIQDKEYTLVGILNDTYSSQYNGLADLLLKADNADLKDRILLVRLRSGKRLEQHVEELKKLVDEKDVEENGMLTTMEGRGIPRELTGALAVIISIVVISTIAVIYNAFQISVVERVKQFGLLRAVGSTPAQIRKIILREASFISAVGIPIGLICGIIALYGIYFSFKLIGGEGVLFISPTISMDVIIISAALGLVSIYISALIPAIFAGKISPLVAISSRNSITKEKIKREKSSIAGRLFGFEGALASRNIKRNRKRYRTTVFSIIISVTLFITFKAFIDMSFNVYDSLNESSKMHFSVVSTGNASEEGPGIGEDIIESIKGLPTVKASYKMYDSNTFYAAIDKNKEIEEIKNIGGIYEDVNYGGEDKALLGGALVVYDEKSLEAARGYLKEGRIDIDELNEENGVIIIGRNVVFNRKTDNYFYGPVANLKVGDEIYLQSHELRNRGSSEGLKFGEGEVKKVRVLGILEDEPFDFMGSQTYIKMISTKELAEKLTGKVKNPTSLRIELKDVKMEDEAKVSIEKIISTEGDLTLINIIARNRQNKSVILMVKILLYGFVVVVSLIGSVNIVNTLTTNIILRRREFATLKSIGLTQKGLKKMITLEGMLYGIVGSFYGSIVGSILSYLLYTGISNAREQIYMPPYQAIAIAAAGAILIGYISVLAPLKRIKKDNLIEAVREDF